MANIHLKTALSYMKRAPFQALAAIFVLSLTFFVATIVSILTISSGNLLKYFETRPQVIAFIKGDIGDSDIASLQEKLQNDSRIKEVKYVSKEEALTIYKKATSSNPLLGELVSPTIFPASLEFSLNDLSLAQEIIDSVKKEPIVESVGFTAALGGESDLGSVVDRLRTITLYVKAGGIIFTGLLAGVSLAVLLITISMRMTVRREEVEILNLIGATKGFIRKPIILEAMLYSLIGVFLGWTIAFIIVLYLSPSLISYFGEIPILPKNSLSLLGIFGIILGIELFIGFILSFAGSMLAVSRARKMR